METLVYKRTHNGDPDENGCFGCNDCMRSVRTWPFDAVIGIGGQSREAEDANIAGKINWIGIGPHRRFVPEWEFPVVEFEHFLDYGTDGPVLGDLAPHLAHRMYVKLARKVMQFSDQERNEIAALLKLAKDSPPSPSLLATPPKNKKRLPTKAPKRLLISN